MKPFCLQKRIIKEYETIQSKNPKNSNDMSKSSRYHKRMKITSRRKEEKGVERKKEKLFVLAVTTIN